MSATPSMSRSLRKKARNMNQIKNFNEIISQTKMPGRIELSSINLADVNKVDLSQYFEFVNEEVWHKLCEWYIASIQLKQV